MKTFLTSDAMLWFLCLVTFVAAVAEIDHELLVGH